MDASGGINHGAAGSIPEGLTAVAGDQSRAYSDGGLLETVVSIARRNALTISRIREAVERGDRESTFALASELVGITPRTVAARQ